MEENSIIQKLCAEVVGTAFLVFIGVGSVPATLHLAGKTSPFTMADLGMISFAFAMAVIAMVYTLGHVSGCHINPAVTVALAVTGKFAWKDVPGYLIAQVIGATLGAWAIVGVLGTEATRLGLGVASYAHSVGAGRAMFAEGIGTFILVFVVFGVIDKRATPGFAGLVIGFAVFAISRLRNHHRRRPGHLRFDQPGPHHWPDDHPGRLQRHGPLVSGSGVSPRRVRRGDPGSGNLPRHRQPEAHSALGRSGCACPCA